MDEARVYFAWTWILGQIWRSLSSIPKSEADGRAPKQEIRARLRELGYLEEALDVR